MPTLSKIVAIVFCLSWTIGCRRAERDVCEQAIARIARINAAGSMPQLSAKHTNDVLEECRHGKYAAYDPVLRCAIDADSDDVAASCIEKFVNSVIRPGAMPGSDSPRGINPLLDPAPDRPTP